MNQTICATCDFLDQKRAKTSDSRTWRCDAPRTRVLDFVSGQEKTPYVLCKDKNTGRCKHWCPYDTTDLMKLLGIKPKSWWSRTFTRKFWVAVIYNIFELTIIYLWVKTHGGITPW